MRKSFLILFIVILTAHVSSTLAADWKAGVSRMKITPEKSLWMSGYAARTKPAEGLINDLYCKALALEDAKGHRTLLITLDLVGIDREFSTRVRDQIQKAHHLERADVALSASHTHSGPVIGTNLRTMLPLEQKYQDLSSEYTADLEKKLAVLADEAFAHMLPATLQWGNGHATFAVNRRNNPEKDVPKLAAEGKLKGPVDHDLPVLAVRDSGGKLVAVVFGYACHATVLSGYEWSGDWPGFAQSDLEQAHPGATALFWQGCGGDQNPLPRRTVELAKKYGNEAAVAVDKVLSGTMKPLDGPMATAYSEIDLPFSEIPPREKWEADLTDKNKSVASRARLLLMKLDRDGHLAKTYPYPIQVWRIGPDLKWVRLGGETVVDYALRLKSELGPDTTWVSGYSNDVMAYIPNRRVLAEGGYEGATSMIPYSLPCPWAPEIEEMIVKEVRRLVDTTGK